MPVKRKRILLWCLCVPTVPYIGLAICGLFLSDRLIFMPHGSSYRDSKEILKFPSTNGHRISALYLADPAARYTLLVSHGNAEDIGDGREWLVGLNRVGFNVFAYDYQGYGTSDGRPSENGSYDDEQAAYDYLTNHLRIPTNRIILLGRSLGTGPAIHIAARRPAAALILQSSFLSAFRVAHITILPFDKFRNYKEISRVRCPVLVIHGTHDNLIGFWQGQKLSRLLISPSNLLQSPGPVTMIWRSLRARST